MKRFLGLILLLFGFNVVNAQDDIATLKATVATTTNDSLKLEAYWLLAKNYRPLDQITARKYIDTVQKIADEAVRTKKQRTCHLLYKANSLTTLANIEIDNENFNESIKYSLQAIKIYEQLGSQNLISVSLSNIGAIFVMTNKPEDAITYLKRSAEIDQNLLKGDKANKELQISVAETMGNLGGVYSKINQADSCIKYYTDALKFYEQNKDTNGIAFTYNGLVTGYRIKKDFKRSLEYATRALDMFKKQRSEKELSQSYINFSDIYLDLKNYTKAIQYADTVEQLCIKNGFIENLIYTYETKVLAYKQMGDLKNQLAYLSKFINLKDSMSNVNNTVAIEELKTQYETEKKEKRISVLQKDNEIQQLQIEKQAAIKNRLIIIIISIIVIAGLLGWLAIFLMRTIRERKEAYLKLQQKNIEIQEQGVLLNEQAKLISKYQSQMNPHFIFNAMNSIQGFVVNNNKDKTLDQLQLFSLLMRQTLNNSNNEYITLDTELDYLNKYIQFEQDRFKQQLKFEVNIPDNSDEIMLPPMMLQPFIENAIKHAGLHAVKDPTITLKIKAEEKLLKVQVSDNGCGFDADKKDVFKPQHAINIIKTRLDILFKAEKLEFLDEYFRIISKPGLETEVTFYLPLKYKY